MYAGGHVRELVGAFRRGTNTVAGAKAREAFGAGAVPANHPPGSVRFFLTRRRSPLTSDATTDDRKSEFSSINRAGPLEVPQVEQRIFGDLDESVGSFRRGDGRNRARSP